MRFKLRSLNVLVLFLTVIQMGNAQDSLVLAKTNTSALNILEAQFLAQYNTEYDAAVEWAKQNGVPMRSVDSSGAVMVIVGYRDNELLVNISNNHDAAKTVSTNKIQVGGSSGLNLTGNGLVAAMWEGGVARSTHDQIVNRVSILDPTAYISDHATHVAGTMIASGINYAYATGMATEATLRSYDNDADYVEMTYEAGNGLVLSNHSYGWASGWYYKDGDHRWFGNTSYGVDEDHKFGLYGYDAERWDEIAFNAPYYLIVKSAGNDRDDTGPGAGIDHYHGLGSIVYNDTHLPDGGSTGYDCLPPRATAKNVLTIGAVDDIVGGYSNPSGVVMSDFSSWGPTDDGRIKPDLVANGVDVLSSLGFVPNSNPLVATNVRIGPKSGTSMAAPNVTGSLLLLQEHFQDTHLGNFCRADALKALVIHTADEAGGADGPDYEYGWGLLNADKAADLIGNDSGNINELLLSNNETFRLEVYNDGSPFRATICWTDPAGTPPANSVDPTDKMLVNDLDLRVIGNATQYSYLPYILNPASPASNAVHGDNDRDNVEQIYLDNPNAGYYTIEVHHKGTLVNSAQNFALVYTGGTAKYTVLRDVEKLNNNNLLDGELSLVDNVTSQERVVSSMTEEQVNVSGEKLYSVLTHEMNIDGLEHYSWNAEQNHKLNWEDLIVTESLFDNGIDAQYATQSAATITSNFPIDVQFQDPWYVSNPAETNPRNWIQPDQLVQLDDQIGASSQVQIFLNQNIFGNPDKPIYRLYAPELVADAAAIYSFDGWTSGVNVTYWPDPLNPSNPNYKAVVFTGANASIDVNYTAVNTQVGSYSVPQNQLLTIPANANISFKSTDNPDNWGEYNTALGFQLVVQGDLVIEEGATLNADMGGTYRWGGIVAGSGSQIEIIGSEIINAYKGFEARHNQFDAVIRNTVFKDNSTAIWLTGDSNYDSDPLQADIRNCTFFNSDVNLQQAFGLDPWPDPYYQLHISFRNNILYSGSAYLGAEDLGYNYLYDCVDNGYFEVTQTEDPEFIDADGGDFRLQGTSPCIDAGDPNSPNDPDDGLYADIGAFYCPQILIDDATTISTNTDWYGKYTVEENVTVATGAKLTITPGSLIQFKDLASNWVRFNVSGNLVADGTSTAPITFTSASLPKEKADWFGILIASSSNDNITIIDNCVVEYSYYGIYLNGTSPDVTNSIVQISNYGYRGQANSSNVSSNKFIDNGYGVYNYAASTTYENNVVRDNTVRGMYFTGTSVPEMYNNTVETNDGYGVFSTNHADVQFGTTTVLGYNEILSNERYGVYASNYSDPFLGTTDPYNSARRGGGNSIVGNDTQYDGYNLKAISNSHVDAQWNYWNPGPVSSTNHDGSSSIKYDHYLSAPPNASILGSTLARTAVVSRFEDCAEYDFFNPDTNSECALWYWAYDLRITDQLPVALWAWQLFVEKYPESPKAPYALVKIVNYTPANERDEIVDYLIRVMQKNTSNPDLRTKALELSVSEQTRSGDYPGAVGQARKLLAHAQTEDQEKIALFSLVDLHKSHLNNNIVAQRYLDILESDYPNDEYSLFAAEIMGQEVDWNNLAKPRGQEEQETIYIPKDFALYPAYPNPFNPVTTIKYDIPRDARVELKVYDIRGQLVHTLVSGIRSAGWYEVQWNGKDSDGRSLPSGLYLYRLQAGKFVANEKMLLLK